MFDCNKKAAQLGGQSRDSFAGILLTGLGYHDFVEKSLYPGVIERDYTS